MTNQQESELNARRQRQKEENTWRDVELAPNEKELAIKERQVLNDLS